MGTRREGVIFVGLVFLTGLLLFRLYEKQVLEHSQYVQAAQAQSTGERSEPASRGRIFVRDKDKKLYPLAVSQWQYQLLISPRQVKNKSKLVESLKADLPEINTDDLMAKINNDKVYVPPILRGIDEDRANKISQKGYAGVFVLPALSRVYPEAQAIAPQTVGFVGGDGQGKYGVEAYYNGQLTGKAGEQQFKRDSLGRLIDIINGRQPEDGSDLVLTLDYNLQFEVENKLKEAISQYQADSGSIIVMDPQTGAIQALANQPNFDPNKFAEVKGQDQRIYLNPAASDVYEPGSVFKPITMAAAIETGVIKPDTTNTFGKSVTVLGKEIKNALDEGFGKENPAQILEHSDNVAMVWVASLLGAEKERDYLDKFGFGRKSGLDLIGEQAGRLPPKQDWNDLLRSTAAFGQGVSVNLVQLASAYSTIANGGELVTPHLAASTVKVDQETPLEFPKRARVITADTATKIKDMLVGVVELGHGKRAAINGLKVGGKTGTAQVPDPQGGYYADQHIGTFAGFFPADNPKFVMVIRLNNPKSVNFAESSAAPTFGEIGEWMANYYGLR